VKRSRGALSDVVAALAIIFSGAGAAFGQAGPAAPSVSPSDEELFGTEALSPAERRARDLERRKAAPPALSVSPAEIRAVVAEGESATVTLTIANAGGRTLTWTIASAPAWLAADERSGSLGFGEKRAVAVVVDPAGVPARAAAVFPAD
jgi:hypothetical protein